VPGNVMLTVADRGERKEEVRRRHGIAGMNERGRRQVDRQARRWQVVEQEPHGW